MMGIERLLQAVDALLDADSSSARAGIYRQFPELLSAEALSDLQEVIRMAEAQPEAEGLAATLKGLARALQLLQQAIKVTDDLERADRLAGMPVLIATLRSEREHGSESDASAGATPV